tara:strand:+ start:390 stop:629 length:240 start_codon:yes stop_codon:yes gene_type:complete
MSGGQIKFRADRGLFYVSAKHPETGRDGWLRLDALLAGKWGELPFGTSSERSLQDLTSTEQTAVLVSLRTLSDIAKQLA